MNFLTTNGPTRIVIKFPRNYYPLLISIVSRRAAKCILRLSEKNLWDEQTVALKPTITYIKVGIELIGFQPSLGRFLAVVPPF